jgi:hypothetical protein
MKRLFEFALCINLSVSPMVVYAQAPGHPTTGQGSTNNEVSQSSVAKCLPLEIKLSDIVDAPTAGLGKNRPAASHGVTVEQKLNELKATCNSDKKLVDGNGKQIVFYHLTGCWGNPPEGYQDILQKQRDEISKLKEQYTVIEMTCNPSGIPIS